MSTDGLTHLGDYVYLGREPVVELTYPQPGLKYTLVGTAGGNDPDTGDIYRGLDRFGRLKDLLWYNTATLATAEEVQHGYDRAGNRLWRADPADAAGRHDELYSYDGLYRLTGVQRGGLNAGKTALAWQTFAQCWGLDATGNWTSFRQDDDGNGVWDLVQGRSANLVNEIIGVNTSTGPAWVRPAYSAAGNMMTVPQPAAPGTSYTATYDAWNRLVQLTAGGRPVAQYQYDGLKRRTLKNRYAAGVLTETRHLYYSSAWQVLEERTGASANAERQFVWGPRYQDELLLRDRDATGGGLLNERLYGLQDANWNLTALADTSSAVQERYAYDAYGMPTVLTASFGPRTSSQFDWEVRYGGYRWDAESGLYQVRNRMYGPHLGVWLQRDPLALTAGLNLYEYVASGPLGTTDPSGEIIFLLLVAAVAGAVIGGSVAYVASGGNSRAVLAGAATGAVLGVIIVLTAGAAGGYTAVASGTQALGHRRDGHVFRRCRVRGGTGACGGGRCLLGSRRHHRPR